jgi:ATP-dependent Clp protease ATP-binding subunit ClpA
VARARACAAQRGEEMLEPLHFALVLFEDERSHAVTAAREAGLDPDDLREAIRAVAPPPGEPGEPSDQIPFDVATKDMLEATLEAAASLQSQYVGTEHLLLALLRLEKVPVAVALRQAGLAVEPVLAVIGRRRQERPTGWRPGFDLGRVCAVAMGLVTEAGLDRVGRAAMVAALLEEIDPATERALRSVGADPAALLEALRREIRADAAS